MSRKPTEVRGEAGVYIGGGEDQSQQGDAGAEQELGAASWPLVRPRPGYQAFCITSSAANRLIGEDVQSRRRPLLGPSPG